MRHNAFCVYYIDRNYRKDNNNNNKNTVLNENKDQLNKVAVNVYFESF